MTSQFELLAPGGDLASIHAAIAAGADAIYCGLGRFNARNRAENLTLEQLKAVLPLAHQHQCKIFVTLNIMLLESELNAVVKLLNQLMRIEIDGVIIQDLGLAYLLKQYYPMLDLHGSTQLNSHNCGQIQLLQQLGCSRVNLSRELSIDEIKPLAQFGLQHDVKMEVFVHGSYCIGFSGLCYMSSLRNGASGNRGRCSQPCRDTYQTTAMGVKHPLNMKDNSAYLDLPLLADAGVYSLKVEGRIKKPHYVYTVVQQWRKQLNSYEQRGQLLTDTSVLYKVFNRDFSDGYLSGNIHRQMFIDNPRNHAAEHFANLANVSNETDRQRIKVQVYDENTAIMRQVDAAVAKLLAEPVSEPSQRKIADVHLPKLHDHAIKQAATLSVLLSSPADIALSETAALPENLQFYWQVPASLARDLTATIALFQRHPQLLPWFPAVLIGDNYDAAITLLQTIKPRTLVSNNSGVGFAAQQLGLHWQAGPMMNISNSYSLLCLQQEFGASGAFISNEIAGFQMKHIKRPANFRLAYMLYQPWALLTSRQCLFQQTTGCRKQKISKSCLPKCAKATTLTNENGEPYRIQKLAGQHNAIYGNEHFMNLALVREHADMFNELFIDLSDIDTATNIGLNKAELICQFAALLDETQCEQAIALLSQQISPTTEGQYHAGL
ncbi:U32 family peptidase [Shewanella sp. C32]|uniref:U32 family peptidase n=1 Tax=Shewanella electrica TaxID=515560 RepID=A0ABT2FMD5_9GAMM|nr:peptidase U32 family protein [Shewanella electrica]MCH1926127.1 U32 family peptidase [Shewanella electrica]MCS4557504.1 U32 family peptidase [Shewanella electrica]